MNSLDKITYDTLRERLKNGDVSLPDYKIKFHLKGEQVEVDGFLSGIEIQALSDHMKDVREAKDPS